MFALISLYDPLMFALTSLYAPLMFALTSLYDPLMCIKVSNKTTALLAIRGEGKQSVRNAATGIVYAARLSSLLSLK